MDVQVLGYTSVQAHRLAFGQLCFLVVGRHTLPVAGTGHPEIREAQVVSVPFCDVPGTFNNSNPAVLILPHPLPHENSGNPVFTSATLEGSSD